MDSVEYGWNLGWSFTPCRPGTNQACRSGWTVEERETLEQALAWAQEGNIAVRTGELSGGLVVIDCDPGADIAALNLPATPTVITPRDGRHFYLTYDKPLKSSASVIAPHVDVRAEGAAATFPGSIRDDGQYTWEPGREPWNVELARLDELAARIGAGEPLEERRERKRQEAERIKQSVRDRLYGKSALRSECERVRSASQGERNSMLNEASFKIGQLVTAGKIDRALAESELRSAAEAVGLPASEIAPTLRSGLGAGELHPRPWDSTPAGTSQQDAAESVLGEDPVEAELAREGTDQQRCRWACKAAAQLDEFDRELAAERIKEATGINLRIIRPEIRRHVPTGRPADAQPMIDIAKVYVNEAWDLRFVVPGDRGSATVWSEAAGRLLGASEFTSKLESGLIEKLSNASDYPAPTDTDPTRHLRQVGWVLKQSWADTLKMLPFESGETGLDPSSKAADAFRLQLVRLWSCPETWFRMVDGSAERMSLAARVREMVHLVRAETPGWRRVLKGVDAFFRVDGDHVWLGMRAELCSGQIKRIVIPSVQKQFDLTRLCVRYGMADETGAVTDRLRDNGRRDRLTVLSRAMCDLIIDMTDIPEEAEVEAGEATEFGF